MTRIKHHEKESSVLRSDLKGDSPYVIILLSLTLGLELFLSPLISKIQQREPRQRAQAARGRSEVAQMQDTAEEGLGDGEVCLGEERIKGQGA